MQSRLCALQTSTTRHPVQHCPAQMRVGCGELEKRESGTCARNARASRHAFGTRTGKREQGWDERRREAERRASWRVCAATEAGVGRYLITAICSASGRATPTDARALLTRETREIQKIHSAIMHACSGMRNRPTVIFSIYSTCTSFSRVAGPRDCRDRNARSCSNAKGLERPLSSGSPPESRQDVSRALLCMQ